MAVVVAHHATKVVFDEVGKSLAYLIRGLCDDLGIPKNAIEACRVVIVGADGVGLVGHDGLVFAVIAVQHRHVADGVANGVNGVLHARHLCEVAVLLRIHLYALPEHIDNHLTGSLYSARQVVKDCIWADDQILYDDEERDCTTIEFNSTQFLKIEEWILSQGCFAKPLEPEWLVNDWNGHILGMAKLANLSI